jgi:hypothetical protein
MPVLRPKTKWIVLACLVLAAAVGVGVAAATLTSTLVSDTHPAGGPASDVRLRIARFDFVPSAGQPTFSSGWHTHPGPVIVQVETGRLKLVQACTTTVVGPGETYIETPELPLIATAKRAAKWTNSFILPADKPLSSPASEPSCADDEEDD